MKISHDNNDGLSFDTEEIKKSLSFENDFLTKLVDTIPARMYFDCEIQEKITADKHLSMDKAVEALKRKSNNFELSAKNKHKRSRLDPFSQKNISQIHDELNKKKRKKKKMKKDIHDPSASLTRAANIEELQRRLHERIELLQAKRKAAQHDPEAQRKQKNKLKKLRQKGNLLKAQAEKVVKVEKVKPEKNKNDKSNEKPVFNKEGNLLYGKFDFSVEGQEDSKKSEYAGKKTKALLKKAEKKQAKLEKLKEADPQKAEFVAEKEKWKKAIQKTEGMKVRDDPKLLKKSLKREQKKKKKSNKEWKQRTDEVEKKKKVRQEKRNQNIQQKKKEKKDRKLKLLKKKGRVIPKS